MRVAFLPLLFLLIPGADPALGEQYRPFIDEPEPPKPSSITEREPWKEQLGGLPPWPDESDLVEFRLDESSPFRYYIDAKHLGVGTDEVVRYTLVAESASGARNVSYEGLRCTPRGQYKVYAYGANRRLDPLPEGDWHDIKAAPADALHRELHGHFLCAPVGFEPRPKKDMIRALKGTIHPRQNSGFLPY